MIYKHKSKKLKVFQVLLCITNYSIKYQSSVYTQVNDQRVGFQTIQLSINHLFSLNFNVKKCESIRSIERTQSGATTPHQSGPRSNGNEEVQHIP